MASRSRLIALSAKNGILIVEVARELRLLHGKPIIEAAIEADVPVQPYALRYLDADGGLHDSADFIGEMTFVESVIAILKSGGMRAELIRLPAIPTKDAHRRELASTARALVASVLSPVADAADNRPAAAYDQTSAVR